MKPCNRHTARRRRAGLLTSVATVLVAGCARPLAPPVRTGEPTGVQLMRTEPIFVGTPFRVLLDFESPSDLAFIGDAPSALIAHDVAHTGGSSLQLPAATRGFTVKLSSLLAEANFPGAWTLAGAYFIAREPTAVQVSYEAGGKVLAKRVVTIEPRVWTPVLLDIAALSDPNNAPPSEAGVLRFSLQHVAVWCDDVVVLDNTRALVHESEKDGGAWSVRQRGLATLIEKPGSFGLRIPTLAIGGDGWKVEEANEMRVRLMSGDGKHAWTIYSDGREYRDGKVESAVELPAAQMAALQQQQSSPAELSVPEELGRVERNAPGDKNNDGYAEQTGAYQLKANGPRLEMRITPRTAKLVRPVLEIAGLPSGHVLVNLEGKLVDKTVRLLNGHVLVELPATLDRPVTLNIRVQ